MPCKCQLLHVSVPDAHADTFPMSILTLCQVLIKMIKSSNANLPEAMGQLISENPNEPDTDPEMPGFLAISSDSSGPPPLSSDSSSDSNLEPTSEEPSDDDVNEMDSRKSREEMRRIV